LNHRRCFNNMFKPRIMLMHFAVKR